MGRIKAIFMDIDSTIIDNRERRIKAIEGVLNVSLSKSQRELAYSAASIDEVLRMVRPSCGKKILDKVLDKYLDDLELYKLDVPAEGAVETLNLIASRGYRIFYITGRPDKRYVEPFLQYMEFPEGELYASRISGKGSVKAKARLMKKALLDSGLSPHEVVTLGDMPHDGLAARTLKIFSIGTVQLSRRSIDELSRYFDVVIEHVRELPAVLKLLEDGVLTASRPGLSNAR